MRGGPKSWEVRYRFATSRGLDEMAALLEKAVATVAAHGDERLFLRVSYNSPLQKFAQLAGFFPPYAEEVFGLNRPIHSATQALPSPSPAGPFQPTPTASLGSTTGLYLRQRAPRQTLQSTNGITPRKLPQLRCGSTSGQPMMRYTPDSGSASRGKGPPHRGLGRAQLPAHDIARTPTPGLGP
jgi:hypothetical protein